MSQHASVERESSLTCRLSNPELAARSAQIREELFAAVEVRQELEQGYAFRFAGSAETLKRLTEFVIAERECCPFFRFEVVVEPDSGPLWLTLTGPAGAKEFIAATFL
jgi:hypothetical protein